MNFLIPLMIWGWIPITVILFRKFPPQKAILISVIGGVLFLPVVSYDLPMINYDKERAIAVSVLIGIIFSTKKTNLAFKPKVIDIPIISLCILSPFLSILVNGLGLYNAVAAVIETCLTWGIFYVAGRIFFSDKDSLRLLSTAIIIGGLIYVPLVLFEVRMSPQLSNIIYGFFPHSFFQHVRYGGYRPIVFMNHGLMVALWMATTFTVSLWLYGNKEITKIKNIPMAVIVILLFISTLLCKSANGWTYSVLGIIGFLYNKKIKSKIIFKILIMLIPTYIIIRISGIVSTDTIINYLSKIFDADRIYSLEWRLSQEEIFGIKALESPFFGWGWMDFAWPIDLVTGENAIRMIDPLYLVIFSIRGFFGLISLYAVLLLGPWKILKFRIESIDVVVLITILIFFAIDTLLNGMINPVFFLISGALISYSEKLKYDKLTESNTI